MAGFGRDPARRCVEQVSLPDAPDALAPTRASPRQEAWISAVGAVLNRRPTLAEFMERCGRVRKDSEFREPFRFCFLGTPVCLSLP